MIVYKVIDRNLKDDEKDSINFADSTKGWVNALGFSCLTWYESSPVSKFVLMRILVY